MGFVEIDGVGKRYGAQRVLDRCSLAIEEGEIVSLLGSSGSGKTTLLNVLAGFVEPECGRVCVGGVDITDVAPNRRGIGMLFQNYALFPHLNVARNIGYGLSVRRRPRAEIRRRVADLLALLGLDGFVERYPHQLSGGQQQRVALARVLALEPRLLLLDEPFSALDAKLRGSMQIELGRLIRRLGLTAVFVTHDQVEALSISDRIAVMRAGRIEQVAAPIELYDRPSTTYVAEFIGLSNLVPTVVEQGVFRLPDGQLCPSDGAGPVTVLIRPENLALSPDEAGNATVGFARHLGPISEYELHVDGMPPLRAVLMRPTDGDIIPVGARVDLRVRDRGACRVLA